MSRRILPAYSSKSSKKKYKQYQLFVVLLCKAWRNISYRDVVETISSNNPAFIGVLSLPETPHFTTIQKSSERTDKALIAFVFNRTLKFFAGLLGSSMMVDGTGFSVNYHSYCDKRLDDFGGKARKNTLKLRYVWMISHSSSFHIAHILGTSVIQRSSGNNWQIQIHHWR